MSDTAAEFLLDQSRPEVETSHAKPAHAPGFFTRIIDAFGRAYTVELPNGEVIFITPY
jgi:hypothetical protein